MRHRLSVVFASALFIIPCAAADQSESLDRLASDLDARRAEMNVPAISVAIVKDDEVIFARGFGQRDLEQGLPATADTLYAIGSSTKAFAATLLCMLAEDGKVDLDAPVRTYVPQFEMQDPAANAGMTVRDLLTHTSGLARTDLMWAAGTADWDDMLGAVKRAKPVSGFREEFHYQNIMYAMTALVVEEATSATWPEQIQSRLFGPLGMGNSNTTIVGLDANPELALGYEWKEPPVATEPRPGEEPKPLKGRFVQLPMRNLDIIAPAGAINSSVLDMTRWLRFQLARGEFEGERLLADAAFDEMYRPVLSAGPDVGYGMGWMVREWKGRTLIEHGGNIDGFSAQVALLPEEGLGMVALANANVTPLVSLAIGMCFDAVLAEGESTVEDGDKEDFTRYVGEYRFDQLGTDVEVLVRDNGSLALDIPGQMVFTLGAPDEEGKRAFQEVGGIEVKFMEEEGEVVGIELFQSGLRFELPRNGIAVASDFEPGELAPYMGSFRSDVMNMTVKVLERDGRLAVDVPGQMVFDLYPPNEEGEWFLRATDTIHLKFVRDDAGNVMTLMMHQAGQVFEMPRVGDAPAIVELPSGEDVQRMVHQANGAEYYLRNINVMLMSGTIDFVNQGITGRIETIFGGYVRSREAIDLGPFGWLLDVTYGQQGWSQSAFSDWEALDWGDALFLRNVRHPAAWHGLWAYWFNDVSVTERTSLEVPDGLDAIDEDVFVVACASDDFKDVMLYVGVDSGLIHRVDLWIPVSSTVSFPQRWWLGDYRWINGVRFPFRAAIDDDMSGMAIIRYEKHELNLSFEWPVFELLEPVEGRVPFVRP